VLVLLAGAVLSASLTFLESARPDWTSWWHLFRPQEFSGIGFTRASGTFAFPNIAAMYWEASLSLALVVLVVGSDVLGSTRRRWMALGAGVLLSVILLHGILATVSRAALGGAALSAGALLILGRSAGDSRRDVRVLACAVLIAEIVLIVATLVRGGPESPLAQRLGWHTSTPADVLSGPDSSRSARERGRFVAVVGDRREPPTLPSRTQLWAAALRLWSHHPLLGVGPDNFRHRYPEVIAVTGDAHFDDERIHANNFYLETLADLGLAGVVVLGLLAYGLWRAARTSLARGTSPLELGIFVAIGTFFVHGCVDYFFEFTPTFGLWWLLLALVGPSDQPTDAAQVGTFAGRHRRVVAQMGARAMTIAPG
jgi:O-antigen ligase